MIPDGSNPPAIKNYFNRRRPKLRYTDVIGISPSSQQFDNELAVPTRFVDIKAVDNDGMYFYQDPIDVPFDAVIDVSHLSAGERWIVDVEG